MKTPSTDPADGSSRQPAVDPTVERLSQAARQLADAASALPPPPDRWGRLQTERARRRRRSRAQVLAVALALPVLVAGVWGARRWLGGASDVAYRIEGPAAVAEGGYIHDVAAAGARLRFTDGTLIDLEAEARAWVVSRGPHGARLRLEGGRVRFDVVHRAEARWSVDAGPFAVEVTGTAFDVAWNGADEELVVDLHRGSVEVRGPLLPPQGLAVRAGERLLARVRDKKVQLDGAPAAAAGPAPAGVSPPPTATPAAAPSPAAEPEAAPTTAVEPAAVSRTAPEAARPRVEHEKRSPRLGGGAPAGRATWGARVAAGEFRTVLDEAEAAGLDQCAATCAIDALAPLADAARYAGRHDLAQRLLLAERARFPGSPPARAAAFLLGRMADEGGAGFTAGARAPAAVAAAIDWYDRYLRESPEGAYAAEALARKMLAVERLRDRPGARRLAEDYLRRYPHGAYAPQAAALMRRP